MIISNNVKDKLQLPQNIIIRINTAWVKTTGELNRILKNNENNEVFLDFPSGRTKPPKPTLTFESLLVAIRKNWNIKYLAISNSEDTEHLAKIRRAVPHRVEIVPKIETALGAENVVQIAKAAKSHTIMLDKEDLYIDVNTVTGAYNKAIKKVRDRCEKANIKVLELRGVIFG